MGTSVLVVEDHAELRHLLERHLRKRGAEVVGVDSIESALHALARPEGFQALLLDMWLPGGSGLQVLERLPQTTKRPATIVMTGEATVETAVGALRIGAIDYLLKPFSMDALDAALARVVTQPSHPPGPPDASAVEEWRRRNAPMMIGRHPLLMRTFEVLSRVSTSDCSVLIQGETGTGKELVARAIHAASGRGSQPYVAVNCAAIPEQLMESELFGHGRGAFTGADKARVGRFALAHKGTLFLDEVGELPLTVQAKLLRALQEKEIVPLGESKPIEVDARVVAATHRNLEQMVEERTFREDLLYRLDVIRVEIPPLRKRREDIPLLAEAFLGELCRKRGLEITGIDPAAMQALMTYSWPGNVRQLNNTLERMMLMRGTGTLELQDVPEKIRGVTRGAVAQHGTSGEPILPAEGLDLRESVERFENGLIRQALERTQGNKNRAAALLKLNRTTLVEKLKKQSRLAEEQDEEGEDPGA